jgi:acetyltransferase-like isoleucine patch superfamily enzyme
MRFPYQLGRLVIHVVNLSREAKMAGTVKRFGFVGVHLGDVEVRGNVKIGKDTFILSGVVRSGPRSRVVIGRRCSLGANVRINCVTHFTGGPHAPHALIPHREADIVVGDDVWIGHNVVITPGRRIRDRAVVGANSVVTHDVPDGCVVGGVPARPIKAAKLYALDLT